MTRHLLSLLLLCLSGALLPAWGQDGRGTVAAIAHSGEVAVVRVECFGHNERAVSDNARKLPFQKLLYEGVEGLADDPIVSKDIDPKQHLWLVKFLTEEKGVGNYEEYIDGVEALGDIRASSAGGYQGAFHIFVKYDRLLRKAKSEGVVKKASTQAGSGGGWL